MRLHSKTTEHQLFKQQLHQVFIKSNGQMAHYAIAFDTQYCRHERFGCLEDSMHIPVLRLICPLLQGLLPIFLMGKWNGFN
jgi:hypothetical protein